MVLYKATKNGKVKMTADEEASLRAEWKSWEDTSTERKLTKIKEIRLQKLQETDWKVTMAKEKGTTLSSGFKTWRQALRDIPSTYSTESKYDELLATDSDGNLTHSVWSE